MFERSDGHGWNRARIPGRAGRLAAVMVCGGLCLGGMSAAGNEAKPRAGTDEARGVTTVVDWQAKRAAREVRTAARARAIRRSSRPKKRKRIEARLLGRDKKPAGRRVARARAAIVGGTIAPAGAYPFFVSVKRATDSFAFCGGTLVSSIWVLTAAHCVDGGITAASLKLVIGANQLSNEAPGDVRSVTAIHLHPAWNPTTFDNDVAMLRLNAASTKAWARMAEPVDPVNPGNTVRAIGHGHTSQGGVASNDLRQVDLPIQSDATMSDPAQYGGSFHGAVMLGAGPLAGGQDTCQGDDGGPLFISGGQVRLVGDTSWGSGCALPNKPGVYGEVYQGALRTFVNGFVGRPANDNFAGSAIFGADGTVAGSNTDATGQTGEPNISGSPADTSVWYSWTAPENGPTSFNLRDATFDTTLHVFTGASFGTLASVASSDDFNGVLQSKLTFNATAGTVYRIAVDGFGAAHGAFSLQWAQNSPATDNFATPATLTGATGKNFTNTARSTGEPGEPNHGSIPDRSVWYSWTAPETGTAVFNTRESDFDTVLAAYTGTTIASLTQLATNDQFNGSNQSRITFPVVAGTVYRIVVDGFGATTGSAGLQWSIGPPVNDAFASGRLLTGPIGTTAATTVRSTGEPGELDYHGGAVADNSVWFRWRPTESGPAVVRLLDVAGGLSPGIGVYTGTSLGALTSVATGASSAAFNAVAGTEYRIAVDGNGGSTGSFTLEHVLGGIAGVLGASWSAPAPVTGDFNGDGFGDLALGAPGENLGAGGVHVLRGSASGLTAAGSKYFTQNTTGIADSPEREDLFGASLAVGDLTGDGIADLAVGAPGENGGAGAVHVLKGSASGLTAAGSQYFSQATSGIFGDPVASDHFGASLAIGDFGGSSHGDLAIGVPDDDAGALADTGGVHVLPGSAAGLTATGSQYWNQDSAGITDAAEAGDRFGAALAAGNMGNGSEADLAIGAPGENVGAGVVHAIYGSAPGLAAAGQQYWHQNTAGIPNAQEAGDHFGASLAIADFGDSAHGDLAIGAPDDDAAALSDAGVVHVVIGSTSGLTATGSNYWYQNAPGISDGDEAGDRFGAMLAAGNVGNGARADLAIGAPGENVGAGVVHAIYGSASGLAAAGQQLWSQNSAGISDADETGDHFGASLAIANFGGSAESELAIGAPEEDRGTLSDAGVLHVVIGSASGLTATGSQEWNQNSAGIADTAEAGDRFGGGAGR